MEAHVEERDGHFYCAEGEPPEDVAGDVELGADDGLVCWFEYGGIVGFEGGKSMRWALVRSSFGRCEIEVLTA